MKICVQEFIDEVINETRPHCKWVKLSVKRYLDDLEHGAERGLYFDEEAAIHALEYFDFLKHTKGEWSGKTFVLEPWQQFQVWNIFGWKREDGTRRFRIAYLEEPRKNGKTQKAAAIGTYLFIADGEPGAEVYSAATKRDQAKISFDEAYRMMQKSEFAQMIHFVKGNMSIINTASKFEPLGADADTLDGLNPQGMIIDELHAHKTGAIWDVMDTAKGARRQPLMIAITTAGFDKNSICWQQHEYLEKILEGIIADDSYFGMIFTIDQEDIDGQKYFDEEVWKKANPNLGVCVKIDDMRDMARKAQEMPSRLNSFLRLKLNVWTESETKWFTNEIWNRCHGNVEENALLGKVCYAGLDLSSTNDITAIVYVFPIETIEGVEAKIVEDEEGELNLPQNMRYKAVCRFFLPEDTINKRIKQARIPYDEWVKGGFIKKTPGNTIDYDYIFAQLDEDSKKFYIKEVAYDPWNATKIIPELDKRNMTTVEMRQGAVTMYPASKEFEKHLMAGLLEHGGNPVLDWMASNVVVKEDEAGNVRPDKGKSSEKIDGIVAFIMGLARAIPGGSGGSVYEDRGVLSF